MDNIISGGYQGEIYPVNPKGGEILGVRAYPDVKEVQDEIDSAFIAVPAPPVFDTVKDGSTFAPAMSSVPP